MRRKPASQPIDALKCDGTKSTSKKTFINSEESSYVLSDVVRGNKSVNSGPVFMFLHGSVRQPAGCVISFIKSCRIYDSRRFILFASESRGCSQPIENEFETGRPDNVISNQPKSANDYHRASPLYVTELQMKVTLARLLAPGPPPDNRASFCSLSRPVRE